MAISELYTPPSSNFSEQIWVQKCLLNKPYWRSIAKKNLFCTLYRALKLVVFYSYMNCKCQKSIQNAELLTTVTQNWHNFFRSYEEMAENRRKQQKYMSLSLTSETAAEYTIWPTNDTYIITVCWVMKNREKQMIWHWMWANPRGWLHRQEDDFLPRPGWTAAGAAWVKWRKQENQAVAGRSWSHSTMPGKIWKSSWMPWVEMILKWAFACIKQALTQGNWHKMIFVVSS